MAEADELSKLAHNLRNVLQRVVTRAELLEAAGTPVERANHKECLIDQVEQAAALVDRIDRLAGSPFGVPRR